MSVKSNDGGGGGYGTRMSVKSHDGRGVMVPYVIESHAWVCRGVYGTIMS